ncbi:receptor-like protein 6 [Ziziphus jujuba]|uniref:Receptor-like protein 6 n=1 Tax=Ziziphus jujuba TaxID=326968 RepID=A0ABM4A7N3_ZIZJJ|nr:receptor-like protein 6 [Ziziphus jujuba]
MAFLPLLHHLLIIITYFAYFVQPLCHNDDSIALLEFKNSFIIDKLLLEILLHIPEFNPGEENRDCCSWDSVACDTDTGCVVALDLSSSFLHGSINSTSTFFNLSQLQRLNLAYNDFDFFQIPSAMGHLSRLTYLNLSHSSFYGQVPFEISRLSNLSFLALSYNDLELKSPNLSSLILVSILDLGNSKLSAKLELEVFNGKGDFLPWCKKMKVVLVQMKVTKAIVGSYGVYVIEDMKVEIDEIVMSTIILHLSNNVLRNVDDVKTTS